MGPKQSQPKKEFQIEINHPRLSKSKIVTEGEEKRLQTSFAVDEKEYDKWRLAGAKYPSIPANLLLPLKATFSRTGMCGHTGTAIVEYNNFSYLLTDQIYNRRGKKTRFTEVELWFLLFSLLRAREQATDIGEKLGDVRPRNVFINEGGDIKVVNSLSWPLEITNIQKTMDKIQTYLAPEDLMRVGKNEFFDGPNEVSEAFSIGLTVLSAANRCDFEDLYDLKNFEFNGGKFNQAIIQWRQDSLYSEVLRGTVLALCQLDVSRRLNTKQASFMLNKHQEQINQKVNFVIDNAPQKLHESIMESRHIVSQLHSNYVHNGAAIVNGLVSSEYTSDWKVKVPVTKGLSPNRQ